MGGCEGLGSEWRDGIGLKNDLLHMEVTTWEFAQVGCGFWGVSLEQQGLDSIRTGRLGNT